jgi:hypothetical protein
MDFCSSGPTKKRPGNGDLHVGFKLSKSGTSIALDNISGNLVDYVTFGAQSSDISMGRYPDGAATLFFMLPNTVPVWDVISSQVVALGQTLSLTASAADADFPAQTLAFTLGTNAPAGAAINTFSDHFTWTPASAPATNSISLIVTANGTPSLNATQTFTVTVVLPPQLGGINAGINQLIFNWPSYAGLNYQLKTNTSLTMPNWTPLGNPVAGTGAPINSTNNINPSHCFYRLRSLP